MDYNEKQAQSYLSSYDKLAEENESVNLTPLEHYKKELAFAKIYTPAMVSYFQKLVELHSNDK